MPLSDFFIIHKEGPFVKRENVKTAAKRRRRGLDFFFVTAAARRVAGALAGFQILRIELEEIKRKQCERRKTGGKCGKANQLFHNLSSCCFRVAYSNGFIIYQHAQKMQVHSELLFVSIKNRVFLDKNAVPEPRIRAED